MLELDNPNLHLLNGKTGAFLVVSGETKPFAEVQTSSSGPLVGDRITLVDSELRNEAYACDFEVVSRKWTMQAIDVADQHETNLEKPTLNSILYLYVQRVG